jgi:hypothetical protein
LAYAFKHERCSTMILPVLCYKLNKYLVYLARCTESKLNCRFAALLPLRLLLIADRKEHKRRVSSGGEAALT